MFKRNKYEVVQPREYSKSETLAYLGGRVVEESSFKPNERVIIPPLLTTALLTKVTSASAATRGTYPTPENIPSELLQGEVIQTGVVADTTLEVLAAIFDPFIEIIVAISFPVASLIVTIGFFLLMFGMKEKALSMIMNAGIGYVLVQMLPLFNQILRTIGEAV